MTAAEKAKALELLQRAVDRSCFVEGQLGVCEQRRDLAAALEVSREALALIRDDVARVLAALAYGSAL